MDSDPEFEDFAEQIVAGWGEPDGGFGYSQLEGRLIALFESRVQFPPHWTPRQRADFIAEQASRDAGELGTHFDDVIDTVTEEMARKAYFEGFGSPTHDDIRPEIDRVRRDALDVLLWRIADDIPELIRERDCEDRAEMSEHD